jgi:hypothetical protein
MNGRLVLVHDSQPKRRVRAMAPANWNILWLRELENIGLSYDLQIDSENDDILMQGCDVMFSALGVSGDLEGKEVDVYFKRTTDERSGGDASVSISDEFRWIDIYVEDYALGFLVMMYEKAQRWDKPLGLWFTGIQGDYRWHVRMDLLDYKRPDKTARS